MPTPARPHTQTRSSLHQVLHRFSRIAFVGLALLGAGGALAGGINPLTLLGNRPKPFIEPDGFYRAILPSGFDCRVPAKRALRCEGTRGKNALLSITVIDVPKSATPELVALNQEGKFKKKEHFKRTYKRRMAIGGNPAVIHGFHYDHYGNVERTVFVEAAYIVQHNKAYVIHFEAHERALPVYRKDLDVLYQSLKLATLDDGGHPIVESIAPKPKRRKALPGGAEAVRQKM